MDSLSLVSSVLMTQQTAAASNRQVAVAANAMHAQQQTVDALIQAIDTAAYSASGRPATGAATGSTFSALA